MGPKPDAVRAFVPAIRNRVTPAKCSDPASVMDSAARAASGAAWAGDIGQEGSEVWGSKVTLNGEPLSKIPQGGEPVNGYRYLKRSE